MSAHLCELIAFASSNTASLNVSVDLYFFDYMYVWAIFVPAL